MARDIKFLVKDIEDATRRAAQSAAVQIMNGLAKAGQLIQASFLPPGTPYPKVQVSEALEVLDVYTHTQSEMYHWPDLKPELGTK